MPLIVSGEVLEYADGMRDDLRCEVAEFEYQTRTVAWYGVVIGVAGILSAWGVVMENYLFAALATGGFVVILVSGRGAPRRVELRVGDGGIVWGERKISYGEVESFAVIRTGPRSGCVALYMRESPSDPLCIPVEEKVPELRERLNERLDEVAYEESVTHALGRFLGIG